MSVTQGTGTQDQVNCGVNDTNIYNSSFSAVITVGGNTSIAQGDGSQDQDDEVNFGVNYAYLDDSSMSCPSTINGNLSVTQEPGTSDQVIFGENRGSYQRLQLLMADRDRRQRVLDPGQRQHRPGACRRGFGGRQHVRNPGQRLRRTR